jgi:hypothetical protein
MANKYEVANMDTSDKKSTVLTLELQESDAFNRLLPKQVDIVISAAMLKDFLGDSTEKASTPAAKPTSKASETSSKKK